MKQLTLLLLCLLLTGCAPIPENGPAVEVFAPTPSDSDAVALGLGLTAHIQKSMHATEAFPGRAHTELTVAAVLVDSRGVIRQCAIDGVRAILSFDAFGTLLTASGTVFPSKSALGADYGMHKASTLGTEWSQQADAFAAACVGKTVDELRGGDVPASVTLSADDLRGAVLRAVENARAEEDLRSGDSLHLICMGVAAPDSRSAGAEAEGLASLRLRAAAGVLRGGRLITCQTAAVTSRLPFTAAGQLACPIYTGLSPLSEVLCPTPVTEEESRTLQALLTEKGG